MRRFESKESQVGVSVVELLVVAVLFFGLLTLVSAFLIRGKRVAVRTETLASVQREASKLVRSLSQDLGRGTFQGALWEPGSLIFLSSKPRNTTEPELEFQVDTGSVLWRMWFAYYLDPPTGIVRRFDSPLSTPVSRPTSAPLPWQPSDLPGLPSSEGQVIAKNIIDFVPVGMAGPNIVEYRVRAEGEVPLGNLSGEEKRVEVELFTTVRLGTVVTP